MYTTIFKVTKWYPASGTYRITGPGPMDRERIRFLIYECYREEVEYLYHEPSGRIRRGDGEWLT